MDKLLMSFLLACLLGSAGAAVFTVGGGTGSQNYVPVNGNTNYGWSKLLFTLAELNAAGLSGASQISGIGMNVENYPANYTLYHQSIFLRNTTASAYAASGEAQPDSTLFTPVFAGTLVLHGPGWFQVAFSQVFSWDGSGGIEILWKNRDGTGQGDYPRFFYTGTSPAYRAVYKHDNVYPTGSGTSYYNRPNLQLITPMAPSPAVALYPLAGGLMLPGSQLLWKSGGGCPTSYDVFLDTADPPAQLVSTGQSSASYTPDLAPGTQYYWKVVPANPYGSPGAAPVWNFNTPAVNQLAESFETGVFPPLGWSNPGNFTSSAIYPYHGSACALAASGIAGNLLATPRLDLNANSRLSFTARTTTTSGNARVRIKYSENGQNWSQLGDALSLTTPGTWQLFDLDLSTLAGQSCYLGLEAFNAGASGNVYIYLDHIVGPPVAGELAAPTLSISSVGADIRLDWTAVSGATGYRLYASGNPDSWPPTPAFLYGPEIQSCVLPAQPRQFFRLTAVTE